MSKWLQRSAPYVRFSQSQASKMSPGRGYPCFPVGSIITRHYVRSTRLKPRSQETNTCRREQTELIWQVKKLADVAKRTPRWRRASIETLRFLRERALVFYRNCVHEAQSELRGPPVSTKPQAARRHDKRPVQATTLERSLAPLQPITSFKNECGAWFPVTISTLLASLETLRLLRETTPRTHFWSLRLA